MTLEEQAHPRPLNGRGSRLSTTAREADTALKRARAGGTDLGGEDGRDQEQAGADNECQEEAKDQGQALVEEGVRGHGDLLGRARYAVVLRHCLPKKGAEKCTQSMRQSPGFRGEADQASAPHPQGELKKSRHQELHKRKGQLVRRLPLTWRKVLSRTAFMLGSWFTCHGWWTTA